MDESIVELFERLYLSAEPFSFDSEGNPDRYDLYIYMNRSKYKVLSFTLLPDNLTLQLLVRNTKRATHSTTIRINREMLLKYFVPCSLG